MGKDDEVKCVKAGKSSSTLDRPKSHTNQANIHVYPANQANIHVYPDWAAMQAYYGPRVPMPAFYSSQSASGHTSHPYMWAPPQTMMPPYGASYAAMYAHGSVYAHTPVPPATNPSSVETPTKSSGDADRDLVKKSKVFDALEMSIGNGSSENAEGEVDQSLSKSSAAEGSSNDGNTSRSNQSKRKRAREGTHPTVREIAGDQKPEMQASMVSTRDINATSNNGLDITVAAVRVPTKSVVSPGLRTVLQLKNLSSLILTCPTKFEQPISVSPETWLQDERELKMEKRKQSNRDSARRSRLRKQAETDELALKVEALNADNESLKSEINRLTEISDRVRIENSLLMEKLKKARVGRLEEIIMNKEEAFATKNLLSRVNNSGALPRDVDEENITYEKKAGAKLHQLLDAKLRTGAIAAS